MNIGLDIMGGDFAPREAVKGVQLYLAERKSPASLFLIGDEPVLNELLKEFQITEHIQVVHAPQVIGMNYLLSLIHI